MPQYARFIKAKNLDKRMVMDYLQGQDPRKVYPLYHAPLVPTFAGSLDIFELKQLEKVKVETKQRRNGDFTSIVQLYDRGRDVSRAGASQDRDEVVAEWLAFSNAVRQVLGCNNYGRGFFMPKIRRTNYVECQWYHPYL